MKKGTVVKFHTPLTEGEKNQKMIVLDWYEDSNKCLVQDVSNLPMPGTHVYLKADLVEA